MVNICKLKLTQLQQEILRLLFIKAGESFGARFLAKYIGVSQPAVSKALPAMKKESLILVKKDNESKRLSIKLNRENPLVMGLKRADNLKMIYEFGLAEFLEESFPGRTIILFGSYSNGGDTKDSDIDIAVIGGKERNINLLSFEKSLQRKIALNFYPSINGVHKSLRENILNGIVLSGGVEL